MKKKQFFLGILLSMLWVFPGQAHDELGPTGIVKENNLWIPANTKGFSKSKITENLFNTILDKIETIYKPIVSEKGATLIIDRSWTSGVVNSYSAKQGQNTWILAIYGGLARHPAITSDGFALVACHQLGHFLGGPPKKAISVNGDHRLSWSSSEGQADYFSTAKCLRKYVEKDDILSNENNASNSANHFIK